MVAYWFIQVDFFSFDHWFSWTNGSSDIGLFNWPMINDMLINEAVKNIYSALDTIEQEVWQNVQIV